MRPCPYVSVCVWCYLLAVISIKMIVKVFVFNPFCEQSFCECVDCFVGAGLDLNQALLDTFHSFAFHLEQCKVICFVWAKCVQQMFVDSVQFVHEFHFFWEIAFGRCLNHLVGACKESTACWAYTKNEKKAHCKHVIANFVWKVAFVVSSLRFEQWFVIAGLVCVDVGLLDIFGTFPFLEALFEWSSCSLNFGICILVSADLFTSFLPWWVANTLDHCKELFWVEIWTNFTICIYMSITKMEKIIAE